jgi:hypothetical protein
MLCSFDGCGSDHSGATRFPDPAAFGGGNLWLRGIPASPGLKSRPAGIGQSVTGPI